MGVSKEDFEVDLEGEFEGVFKRVFKGHLEGDSKGDLRGLQTARYLPQSSGTCPRALGPVPELWDLWKCQYCLKKKIPEIFHSRGEAIFYECLTFQGGKKRFF